MSSIGPGNIGALNLAGSFAGASRGEVNTDRDKASSAEQKFMVDQQAMSLDGIAEAELSSERDADGRLPYAQIEQPEVPSEEEEEDQEQQSQPLPSPDAFGERGTSLDLEA